MTDRVVFVSRSLVLAAGLALGLRLDVQSARADESATEPAKQSQNPIANLISVPFQIKFLFPE